MGHLLQDLRYAVRMLMKSPGLTSVAVLSLALGLGANTAIFSIINGVLLQPLPYDHPERLVMLWEDPTGQGQGRNTVSAAVLDGWKRQDVAFENISPIRRVSLNLTGEGQPERLAGLQVAAGYLDILRLKPELGRGFLAGEDQAGKDRIVILTHELWQRRFGGDRSVLGRSIRLDGETRTVIGILPPRSPLLREADLLVPFVQGSEAWHQSYSDHRLQVVARLKPSATLAQARQEMKVITARQRQFFPPFKKNWGVTVNPLHGEVTREVRPQLLLLLGATGFVLLIACANVANLLLARAVARRKEMAVRSALGAGRWSVVRQLLTESVLLATAGGAAGLWLASWGVDAFRNWRPSGLPSSLEVGLDGTVLLFALLASLLTGVGFGLAPAWRLARSDFDLLKEGGRTSEATSGAGLRKTLIVSQVALSFILMVSAGLLLRSLLRMQTVPLGFNPEGVLAMDISLDERAYPDPGRRMAFLREVFQRVESLPGVDSAGMATTLPMSGSTDNFISAEGRKTADEARPSTDYDFVSGSYFRVLGMSLVQGRLFSERDSSVGASRTAILDVSLARALFPGENPIARRVRFLGQTWEVAGVVGDVLHHGPDRGASNHIYLPQAASFIPGGSLVVRTKVPPLSLGESIRAAIFAVSPDQPVSNLRTLDQVVAGYIVERRLVLWLLGLFAALALGMAAIGLYGVMAFSVNQREHEIGIRSALGASRGTILRMVVTSGIKLTMVGVGLGLLGAIAVSRVLSGFLVGVAPHDPVTLLGAALLLTSVALLACWLPARRAARIDPMTALRSE